MAEGLRKTISHAGVYGTGTVLQNIVSIVMLPVYTRFLTPADYGVLNLLEVIVSLVGVFVGSQLAAGIMRYYFAARGPEDAGHVISTAMIMVLSGKALGVAVVLLGADGIAPFVFGEPGYAGYLRLFAFVLITDALFQIPFMYLRVLERPATFVALSVAKLVLQLGLNIYFVVYLELAVLGVIYASILSGAVLGGAMALWMLNSTGGRFRMRHARKLLTYSWPIVIAGFVGFYVGQGQRYFLNVFWDLAQVGLFGLAWRIAEMINVLVWRPINQVWGVQRFKVYKMPDGVETFQRMFRLVVLLFAVVGTGIAIIAEEVLEVMSDRAFWAAAEIVPFLVVAAVLQPLEIFSRMGIVASEETQHILYGRLLAGVVATIGFLSLIPPLAGIGAALSMVAARSAMLWWVHRQARKFYDMQLEWRKFYLALGAGFAAYVAADLLSPAALLPAVGIKFAVWVTFCIGIFYSPVLTGSDRISVYGLLREGRQRIFGGSGT